MNKLGVFLLIIIIILTIILSITTFNYFRIKGQSNSYYLNYLSNERDIEDYEIELENYKNNLEQNQEQNQ